LFRGEFDIPFSMILDPTTRAEVIERTAQILAEEVKTTMGGIEGVIVIDLGTVAQCLGVTKGWARTVLPVKRITARTSGVLLSDLKAHLGKL
jgi:hypothetical protein